MEFEIREIQGPEEMEEVIELQAVVGGLPPKDTMSPITLTALTQKYCRTGWVLGAFKEGKMVAFCIGLAAAEHDLVFGHMLGVLPQYRDSGVGNQILMTSFELYRESGKRRVCWTYEPLESRNSHLYLNRLGGRCIRYVEAHYYLDSGLHHGMPQDRFLIMLELDRMRDRRKELPPLQEALARYPVATADHMPDTGSVLVEIPADLRGLQAEDPEAALAWRMNTRVVLEEYVNQKGMTADALFSGIQEGKRRCFYLLERQGR